MSDGQQTLSEYADDDTDDTPEEALDALREDIDDLTAALNTIVQTQQDLAETVEEALDDGAETPTDRTDDVADTSPGFQ